MKRLVQNWFVLFIEQSVFVQSICDVGWVRLTMVVQWPARIRLDAAQTSERVEGLHGRSGGHGRSGQTAPNVHNLT